jgi:predicted membrane protein (TIGR00267 family)
MIGLEYRFRNKYMNIKNQQSPSHTIEDVLNEKERVSKLGRIRQFIFGTLDGLLVPVGVVSAVAGGTGNTKAVIIAGIAESFAGALSMGAGEFISGRSEAQVQKAEIAKEVKAIHDYPEFEFQEMIELFEHEGVSKEDSKQISEILQKYNQSFKKTMVEKELGIEVQPDTVKLPEALTMGVSYIIGSIFPLIAYFFFPINIAFPLSLCLTVLALIIIGIIKGKLAELNLFRSTLEIVFVGILSAGGGYILGTLIPKLFGF